MTQNLSRRRFTRLALTSTAAAAIATLLPRKSVAHNSMTLYGASADPKGNISIKTIDLTTQSVEDISSLASGVTVQPGDLVSGFTALKDGTLVLIVSSSKSSNANDHPPRLMLLNKSNKTLDLFGTYRNYKLKSVYSTNDGSLKALLTSSNPKLPPKIGAINYQTGEVRIVSQVNPPSGERITHLTQCPNGTLLAAAADLHGETSLIQLDPVQGSPTKTIPLSFNNKVWNSGLRSFACSPSGQILVLAAERYNPYKSLFLVDSNSGVMTRLNNFEVNKITFAQS